MRRVTRILLDSKTSRELTRKQMRADERHQAGKLDANRDWDNARKTKPILVVLNALKVMSGSRERCMYCLDSHGTDIEHFRPKAFYPMRMFDWLNLLLCCTDCGRIKGDSFPLSNGQPLLIDPTIEEPWQHLDFDPTTGNVVARFDTETNDWSRKGQATVDILHFDRREALANGYLQTFRRLSELVIAFLTDGTASADSMVQALQKADDHGLLGWCVFGTGGNVEPFRVLRVQHSEVWFSLEKAIQERMWD